MRIRSRYISSVESPDEQLLRLSREMREAFRILCRDHFARWPDIPFRSYLAHFPRLCVAAAASCKGVVTECKVRDALKQVSLNKSPGLDCLPEEVYLRQPQTE